MSAGLVWIGVAAWFGFSADWPPNESFLRYGHYSAAIPMFALIIFVVLHNGWLSRKELVIGGKPVSYRPIYKWIGFLMALTVAVGVVWWLVTRADEDAPDVIFGVEAVLLGFFMLFWALQTLEFRRSGLPPEARSTSD